MYPRNIGRALGIGVRVAGRIAGRSVAGQAQARVGSPAQRAPSSSACASAAATQSRAQVAGQIAAQTTRGLGGFLRPFRRVGGIVWLEVTGTFFLLFALIFALRLWQTWTETKGIGKDFAVAAAVVFLYLGVSSFWRARRR